MAISLEEIQSYFSRKNIYFFVLIAMVVLAIFYGLKSEWRNIIEIIFFNPLWPTVLIILDIYLQHRDSDIIETNRRKIANAGSVLRTASKVECDNSTLINLLLEALNGDDLLEKEIADQKEKELEEKTLKAGRVEKKETNIEEF